MFTVAREDNRPFLRIHVVPFAVVGVTALQGHYKLAANRSAEGMRVCTEFQLLKINLFVCEQQRVHSSTREGLIKRGVSKSASN